MVTPLNLPTSTESSAGNSSTDSTGRVTISGPLSRDASAPSEYPHRATLGCKVRSAAIEFVLQKSVPGPWAKVCGQGLDSLDVRTCSSRRLATRTTRW